MEEIYDVIIVGSGPAGLTAGLYTSRANLKTLIIGGEKWGGQLMLTTLVENYPGFPEGIQGPELMQRMRDQTERHGAKFLQADITGIDFSKKPFVANVGQNVYLGKAIILSTGAKTKWLELPAEQRLIGRGVSSCAPCDAPFFKGKKVVVVGGGDSAMEEALVLAKFTPEVTIVHRKNSFRASQIMQDRVKNNPAIKIIFNTEVTDVLGTDKVTGIKIKNSQTNQEQEMAIDGLFVAIGHIPVTELFASDIHVDEKGYVVSRRHEPQNLLDKTDIPITQRYHSMTSIEGVFSAGDIHDYHYRQAVTAAGYGCEAALDVERWLTEEK
ncbi:MAG: thioredoxin-disulfide reductase [bacterium]|nr:thioredoxin-disulfide reductase [bacterium]